MSMTYTALQTSSRLANNTVFNFVTVFVKDSPSGARKAGDVFKYHRTVKAAQKWMTGDRAAFLTIKPIKAEATVAEQLRSMADELAAGEWEPVEWDGVS